MTVFVGAHASGKTSVARALASLAGRTLRQVALTAATDTSELLGSFEQREPARDRAAVEAELVDALRAVTEDAARRGLAEGPSPSPSPSPSPRENNSRTKTVDLVESAWAAWGAYRAIADETAALETTATAADAARARGALETAVESLERLLLSSSGTDAGDDTRLIRGGSAGVPNDASRRDSSTHGKIASIRARLASLGAEAWGGGAPAAGRFEWVDGVLLRAATEGEWVLLENANLCSPTVLDRLNPLLETNGTLLVSESGAGSDGTPRVVEAHPDFRLFLALDPRRGEVSRAMRNRGVEVFLESPQESQKEVIATSPAEPTTRDASLAAAALGRLPAPLSATRLDRDVGADDLDGVLAAAGVPAGAARDAMAAAHRTVADPTAAIAGDSPGAKEKAPKAFASLAAARAAAAEWRARAEVAG